MGVLLALLGVFAIAGPLARASAAEFGIAPGGFSAGMLDAEGNPENLAGSHPDRLRIDFALNVAETGTTAREIVFDLPPGFGGNPGAVPECPRQTFEAGEECPAESQVGTAQFAISGGLGSALPIFQLEPEPGQLIAFGTKPSFEVPFSTELRPSDYGLTLTAANPQQVAVSKGRLELWGVPADHQEGTAIPRRALLTAPSRCGPLDFTFRTRSWQEGAPWLSAAADAGPLTGCETLGFAPRLGMALSEPVADSPTGLRMDVDMPEDGDASARANAQVKDLTVEMPEGVTVSPGGAETLAACTDSQLGLGSTAEALCPEASKVGSVEFSSPVAPEPLSGAVYLGQERPGERFRLFIVVKHPGIVLKFVGALHADPATGRLSTTLRDLPQVPLRRLSLNFAGGPNALLASPLACGPATALAKVDPYGGGLRVDTSAQVTIAARTPGTPCPGPGPFAPQIAIASSNPASGRPTSISLALRRHDGEQLPARFSATLPAGLSAALGTVQVCRDSEVAAAACPPGSQIGEALARIGSGASLAALRGSVYLTGPYRGGPFGLLIEFHAALGPLDLGVISARASMQVDGRTGRLTVSLSQFPDALEGVQVRFQSFELELNRPGFIRNPTSCGPAKLNATTEAQGGASVAATSAFPVRGCSKLGFRPRVQIALEGDGLRRHGHPGLRVSAHLRRGDSNLRAMALSFPPALKLDAAGAEEICSQRDAIDNRCPDRARVGTATALTPLLSRRFTGGVYVVQPRGDGPPDLWVSLVAMGVHVDMKGTTSTRKGHLVTNLTGLPDIPLSSFTMRVGHGGKGLFTLDADPCVDGRPRRFGSTISVKGQNGAQRKLRAPVGIEAGCRSSGSER